MHHFGGVVDTEFHENSLFMRIDGVDADV